MQTLAAGFNEAAAAKRFPNRIVQTLTRDFSPQSAEPFATINTNIAASTYNPTNLPSGGGTEATPVNLKMDPGPVVLDHHPVIVLDLPSVDQTLAGNSWVVKAIDEAYKTLSNDINKAVAGVFTAATFSAYPPIDGSAYPENSAFSGNPISVDNNVTTTAFMAAWDILAGNGIPVGDVGNFFMMSSTGVYANVILNPNWVMAANIGDTPASLISTTARFSSRFGAVVDWDPHLNLAATPVAAVYHRYAGAIVARSVAPPRNPSIPCTYVDLFPGVGGHPGITARLVIDFWPPAAADRLLIDRRAA